MSQSSDENSLDYSPQATHELYMDAEHIPRLEPNELIARINALDELGYVAIAGVLVADSQLSVRAALQLLETSSTHLAKGAIVGPYCFSYSVALPGVKLYMRS